MQLLKILFETTRVQRETGRDLSNWQEKLSAYEAEGDYFIHFSRVPRMALNPVNIYKTPLGFYSYPLERNSIENFAVNRPYAIVFKPKSESDLLDVQLYSESDLQKDILKLIEMGYPEDKIKKAAKSAKINIPAGQIWNVPESGF